MAIRVMIVDEDINFMKEVKQYFSSSSSINVVKTVSSKEEAISSSLEYDVLVINMLLKGTDSMDILDDLIKRQLNKTVIVTSEYISIEMMNMLSVYRPSYFIKKPFELSALERIVNALSIDEVKVPVNDSNNELKVDITNLLHSLGIPSHIKGYSYIRDSIEMLIMDHNIAGSMTKEIYPNIANSYATTSSRVERAIRHAIEVSWMRGDYNLMEEIFGNSIDYDRSKPTNSEFIATLADRLKLQKNYA